MERNGFNAPNFESNTSSPEDSKEKSKSKKKKSAESAPVPVESKKEEVAGKGKSLWEKLVGDDKEKTNEKPDKKTDKEQLNYRIENSCDVYHRSIRCRVLISNISGGGKK